MEKNIFFTRKKRFFLLILCALLIIGFVVIIRDWYGVRLLAVSPEIYKYRHVIRHHASTHELDWKLIIALIVQESGFNEYAISPAGAKGLMQLMPETAKELGVTDPYNAEESIAGATRYLRSLYDLYPDSSHPNRVRIALASYNGGRGHIKDAQRITLHHKGQPNQWESLRSHLSLLTEKDRELHAEVWESGKPPHGYYNGFGETIDYVDKVMRYYDRLCHFAEIVRKVKFFKSM